jgi:hemerythrin-like domain-containing protein
MAADAAATGEIVQHAQQFIPLLRSHIEKENHVLFVMADSILPPEEQQRLSSRYGRFADEEVGCRIHEEPTALIRALEAAL